MAKTRLAYAPEFRRRMVELVHAGRTPEELASELEPTAQSIRNWVAQSERNAGRGDGGLVRSGDERDSCEGFRFVSDHQASCPIVTMCKLLGVSSSGYYAWVKRRPSRRAETDAALIAEIRAAHGASHGTYGAPRIRAELAAKGIHLGRKLVARLMSQAGLVGVSRRKFVVATVKGDSRQTPDLVELRRAAWSKGFLTRVLAQL
jgi:putative transposase